MLTIIHGSHRHGHCWDVANALKKELENHNIELEIIDLSTSNINFCCGDQVCQSGECIYLQDDFSERISNKILNSEGIFIITPTYFNMPPAKLKSFIDRTNALLPFFEKTDNKPLFGAYVCGEADDESVNNHLSLLIDYAAIMGWENKESLNITELITDDTIVDGNKVKAIAEVIIEDLLLKGK